MLRLKLVLSVCGVLAGCFFVSEGPNCWAQTPVLEDHAAPVKQALVKQLDEQPLDPRITPETLAAFDRGVFEAQGGMTLPFRLLRPLTVDEKKTYPLVLFLHGKGERGDENQRQLIHGSRMFASESFRKRYPAYVVAPQCPAGTEPGTVSRKKDAPPGTEGDRVWTWPLERLKTPTVDLSKKPTPQLAAVRQLVDKLRDELPIDDTRIYVCGLSMGGYATWELAAREPGLWAAAVPICGASDPSHAARLAHLPIWNLHGEADQVIPVERSREMVSAINTAGGRVIYTEYPGVGHGSWAPTFESRHVWDWMFAQRR